MNLRKLFFSKNNASKANVLDELPTYIQWLPDETLLPILASLTTCDLLAFRQTSTSNNAISTDNNLWKSRFFQAYPNFISGASKQENYFSCFLTESQKHYYNHKLSLEEKQILNFIKYNDLKNLENIKNSKLIKVLLSLLDKSQEEEITCSTEHDHLNPFNLAYQRGFQQILDHFYQIFSAEYSFSKDKKSDLTVMAVRCNQEVIVEKNFHKMHLEQQGRAFLIVIRYGYVNLIEGCLLSSLNKNIIVGKEGVKVNPIWLAGTLGKTAVLRAILHRAPEQVYTKRDRFGCNLLQHAAKNKHVEIIKTLIDYEAKLQRSARHFTNQIGKLAVLSINSYTPTTTILHLALEENASDCLIHKNYSETALALLDACDLSEFNPNKTDWSRDPEYQYKTVLHLAVKKGLVDVVEKLTQFKKLDVLVTDQGWQANDRKIAYERIPSNDKNKDKIAYLLLKNENFLLTLENYIKERNNESSFFRSSKEQKILAATELKRYLETVIKPDSLLELKMEDLKTLDEELMRDKNAALRDGRLNSIYERIRMFIKLKEKFEPSKEKNENSHSPMFQPKN